jgi:hypothetical protein
MNPPTSNQPEVYHWENPRICATCQFFYRDTADPITPGCPACAMKDILPFLRKIRNQYNGVHVSADAYIENNGEWTLLDHAYITQQGEERTWEDDETLQIHP